MTEECDIDGGTPCGYCYPDECRHENTWFDRTLCACGMMHTFCEDCGVCMGYCTVPGADRGGSRPGWRL